MAQCEMCGAEKSSLTTTKVEGAELELCDDCKDFGTEVKTESSSTTSTKYSTSSDESSSSSSGGTSTGGGGGGGRRRDMFDQMDEIAGDYDEQIRSAREREGLSREDLAKELNEKASLISKLERGDILPSDDVRGKLEKRLGVSLSEGSDDDTADWETDSSMSQTLGDVVERKGE
ncbi:MULTISPECIES: multiprotein bridging factor aMBF1 [Halolamina]|uniref:Putative transcription factor n=1 Tax=Halolamina pelagica TaxID=699431 RepID=A0A1I5P6T3_9EURY|nr:MULTISPECIES: multiprotein bridging factor aMBF1 [Halolamina]NHX36636.1 TIGR00270 family protein [Halolamina sp. R1-12]SFP29176.1 putative transcription factor [Halolamina pelagica]